jgi:uncharacterized membrane protein
MLYWNENNITFYYSVVILILPGLVKRLNERILTMQGETMTPTSETTDNHKHHYALFMHAAHPHQPRNVNLVHEAELAAAGFNTRLAVGLTQSVGTMWTAYTFAVLAIIGLFAILGLLSPIVALLIAWLSQTFIQLVLLPIIMVGQNVLGRKAELQADEQFNTTIKTYHDIEQVMAHLVAQDAELLKQSNMIIQLLQSAGIPPQPVDAQETIGA